MNKTEGIDIINEVLEACILAYPVSSFIISLYQQYQQRGSLSKKQLQGLHAKASKIKDISPAKLATVEAIIKKMPTRYKSELPQSSNIDKENIEDLASKLIEEILAKYPQHKRVLYLKCKQESKEPLSSAELNELKKFKQLLK